MKNDAGASMINPICRVFNHFRLNACGLDSKPVQKSSGNPPKSSHKPRKLKSGSPVAVQGQTPLKSRCRGFIEHALFESLISGWECCVQFLGSFRFAGWFHLKFKNIVAKPQHFRWCYILQWNHPSGPTSDSITRIKSDVNTFLNKIINKYSFIKSFILCNYCITLHDTIL